MDVALCLDEAPSGRAGPGIVVFDKPTVEVREWIRAASRCGLERVVALATLPRHGCHDDDWALLAAGAADVLSWDPGAHPAAQLAARFERWAQVDALVASPAVRDRLVGHSPAWIGVLRRLVEVACFTDLPVLLMGETGTGKELVARMIHDLDARPDKARFVVLDCTTVVPSLSGSEFFGHDKGAYTGATSPREGAFALANKGTLFLDEVGELPPPLQAELLRVIQEGTYKRVGSNVWNKTRFRLVCATNRDLVEEQRAGRFRSDLFFRIAGCRARLPALRERTADIPALVDCFFRQVRPAQPPPLLDPEVRGFLLARAYPGNIRDLKHVVTCMSHRHVGPGPVTIGDIPEDARPLSEPCDNGWALDPESAPDGVFDTDVGDLAATEAAAARSPAGPWRDLR